MARDVESLVLQMSADLRRFDKSMAAMRQTADRRLTEVERRVVQSDKRLSQIMGRAGDNMVGSLKSSLASTVANGSGEASLPIWPMLRKSPTDNAVIELSAPKIEGYVPTGQEWSISSLKSVGLSFTVTERG